MSSELLNIILAITSILTTITIVITLAVVAWQTMQTARQTKLNTIISYHQYIKDVNVVLLQNEETAQRLLGESKEDAVASIILANLQIAFKLHQGHLTDSRWWKSDEAMVAYAMKEEPMRRHWEQSKHLYYQDFVQFIENKRRELELTKNPTQLPHPVSENTTS